MIFNEEMAADENRAAIVATVACVYAPYRLVINQALLDHTFQR